MFDFPINWIFLNFLEFLFDNSVPNWVHTTFYKNFLSEIVKAYLHKNHFLQVFVGICNSNFVASCTLMMSQKILLFWPLLFLSQNCQLLIISGPYIDKKARTSLSFDIIDGQELESTNFFGTFGETYAIWISFFISELQTFLHYCNLKKLHEIKYSENSIEFIIFHTNIFQKIWLLKSSKQVKAERRKKNIFSYEMLFNLSQIRCSWFFVRHMLFAKFIILLWAVDSMEYLKAKIWGGGNLHRLREIFKGFYDMIGVRKEKI